MRHYLPERRLQAAITLPTLCGALLLWSYAPVHGQATPETLPTPSFPPIPEIKLQPLPPLLNNLDPSRELLPAPQPNTPSSPDAPPQPPKSTDPTKQPPPGNQPAPANQPAPRKIYLSDVLVSLDEFYPLLWAVAQERGIAAGELLAAEGAFDTKLAGASI